MYNLMTTTNGILWFEELPSLLSKVGHQWSFQVLNRPLLDRKHPRIVGAPLPKACSQVPSQDRES
jgi:hypothetical protein